MSVIRVPNPSTLTMLPPNRARLRHGDYTLTVTYVHKGGPQNQYARQWTTRRGQVSGRNVIVKATVTGPRVTGREVAVFGLAAIEEVLSNMPILQARRPRHRTVPDGGTYPDEFYDRVARLWVWLVSQGYDRPVREVAEQYGVAEATAHRWIKEARARALLAPSAASIGG